jgi:hypothetical protein
MMTRGHKTTHSDRSTLDLRDGFTASTVAYDLDRSSALGIELKEVGLAAQVFQTSRGLPNPTALTRWHYNLNGASVGRMHSEREKIPRIGLGFPE